jgi:hypothetical protein
VFCLVVQVEYRRSPGYLHGVPSRAEEGSNRQQTAIFLGLKLVWDLPWRKQATGVGFLGDLHWNVPSVSKGRRATIITTL